MYLGVVEDVVDARVGSLQEQVCSAGHFLLPMDQDAAIELADITEVGDLKRKPWVGNQFFKLTNGWKSPCIIDHAK